MARLGAGAPKAKWRPDPAGIYFSDRFDVPPSALAKYGALDMCVVSDLPLFIDPFLLFNSDRPEYLALHNQIVDYLRFLRAKSDEPLARGLIDHWYTFGEVRQNWLGFTVDGNRGHGLGRDFAEALHSSLGSILDNLGAETVTVSSHLEKLTLIRSGVGKDTISDFTTNLIKHYLCKFTEEFATQNVARKHLRRVPVQSAVFNYNTESWAVREYTLPWHNNDFLLLTPLDLLTTDDTWINRSDMLKHFDRLVASLGDEQLRHRLSNYFAKLVSKEPTEAELRAARVATLRVFPELIDYYIRSKEDSGDLARRTCAERTQAAECALITQVQAAAKELLGKTKLFQQPLTTHSEARRVVGIFKDYVEHQDGYRVVNQGLGKTGFANEAQVQGFFGLLLQESRFDVNREPNNGRGPVDFKLSGGAHDKTLIEFKLASNSSLKRNLLGQVDVYKRANKTRTAITVILFFTEQENRKLEKVLAEMPSDKLSDIVVIDARADNKPSASKA